MEKYTYFRHPTRHRLTKGGKVRSSALEEGQLYVFQNGQLVLVDQNAIPREPKFVIRVNSFYRSKDGRKIQIFAVNPDSKDKPVVGMIQSDGIWETRYWNFDGIVKIPYGPGNDIVAEWSEA